MRTMVFEGESGIGKSRLLDALVSLAKKNGCMVSQDKNYIIALL